MIKKTIYLHVLRASAFAASASAGASRIRSTRPACRGRLLPSARGSTGACLGKIVIFQNIRNWETEDEYVYRPTGFPSLVVRSLECSTAEFFFINRESISATNYFHFHLLAYYFDGGRSVCSWRQRRPVALQGALVLGPGLGLAQLLPGKAF